MMYTPPKLDPHLKYLFPTPKYNVYCDVRMMYAPQNSRFKIQEIAESQQL